MPKPTRPQRPVLALLSIVTLAVLAAIALVPAAGGSKANAEPLLSGDPSFSQPQFSEAPSDEPTPPQEQCQASDFAGPQLPAGSLTISGKVTDAANAVGGLGGIRVRIFGPGGSTGDIYTNGDGTYAMIGLADGSYRVSFYDNIGQYQSVFYDAGALVLSPPTSPSVVLAGSDSPPIDAALPAEEPVDISGLITDSQSLAFPGAKLTANARYFPMSGCGTSQGDGTYVMSAVRSGVYRVQVVDPSAQNPTGYFSADVAGGWVASAASATDVIADGASVGDIDIQFPATFTLSGSVHNEALANVEGMFLSACMVDNGPCRTGYSDVDGLFAIGGLPEGDYLLFEFGGGLGYLNAYYDGPDAVALTRAEATAISVPSGTGIDLLAVTAPIVSGKVTDAGSVGIEGAQVNFYEEETGDSGYGLTDALGDYTTTALQPGTYLIQVFDYTYAHPSGYRGPGGVLVADPADAERIVVGTDDLGDVDMVIPDGGALEVSITKGGSPEPYPYVQVCLATGTCVAEGSADDLGRITFPALLPDTYIIAITTDLQRWYLEGDVAVEDPLDATPVVITASTTTSIDVLLPSPGTPTPEGTNVPVPLDDGSNTNPVNLTFASVTGSGTTSLTIPETPPDVPSGFQVGDPPTYYDIVTTATFSGTVEVCVSFNPAAYLDPAGVRLLHFVEAADPQWQDITQLPVDAVNGVVCGFTTSFSPFLLAERTYDFQGFFGTKPLPHLNDGKAGDTIGVQFSLGGDVGLTIFEDGSPTWQQADCATGAAIGDPNIALAGAALKFNAHTGRYTFSWKTEKSWKKSCRLLTLTFRDGTAASALFRFLK